MSKRSDRDAGGSGTRVVIFAVVVLLLAGASWQVWQRMQSAPPAGPAAPSSPGTAGNGSRTEEPLPATLYLPANGMLAAQPFAVRRQPEPQLQAREAAAAVLSGERSMLTPVLKDLRLRALYLDQAGTAFLDLSSRQPQQKEIHASAWDELLAVYAVVNTIMQNVPEVRQVRFLLDGREAQTLAGHVDLSRSFIRRTDLVLSQ